MTGKPPREGACRCVVIKPRKRLNDQILGLICSKAVEMIVYAPLIEFDRCEIIGSSKSK